MLCILLIQIVHAKHIRDNIHLTDEAPAAYITKFGVDLGTGSWEMKARLAKGNKDYDSKSKFPIQLLLYRDTDFTEEAFVCRTTDSATQFQIDVPQDAKWSEVHKGTLGEQDTPHIWFFVLADCDRSLGSRAKVKIELTILSGDESHLSVELKGMKRIYIFTAIILTLLWSSNLWKLCKFLSTNDSWETNIIILNIAIGLEFISLVCYTVHISSYEYNGRGVNAFEFFGNATGLVSEFLMMMLLILIAYGWTLKYKDFPQPEVFVPILIALILFQLIISGIERISKDAYYTFSHFEGTVGLVLAIERVCILIWLLNGAKNTSNSLPLRTSNFLKKLVVLSVAYILAVPVLVVFAQFLPAFKRQKVIVGGALLIHGATMAKLSYLFTTKSEYYKVSTMSAADLPFTKAHTN